MEKTKMIQYRSIIDHPNSQKISDRCEIEAVHKFLFNEESYTFQHPTYGMMKVLLKGGKVILSYGNAAMEMIFDKKHRILYNTMYGPMELDVYLKKMERTNNSLHLVYYLYDRDSLLSKCYLMIDEINPILS